MTQDKKPGKPSLTVKYRATQPDRHPAIYAYALTVEIVNAVEYPDHLFVFHRSPENNEGDSVDEFIQIASPAEIEEVPEDAPRPEENMPYYRTKEVTLWFRTMEDLELAKRKIKDDLQTLVLTYDVLADDPDMKEEIETYG